jgi:hypothetical protein
MMQRAQKSSKKYRLKAEEGTTDASLGKNRYQA